MLYTSSNPSVATISNTGLVTAVSTGETTITVTDEDNAVTKEFTIYVEDEAEITVTEKTIHMKENTAQTVSFTKNPLDMDITYSSSNPSVATVDGDGYIEALHEGTAVITVSDVENTVSDTVTVIVEKENSLDIAEDNITLTEGETGRMTINKTPSNLAIIFSNGGGVVSVDSNGNITALAPGTVTIMVQDVENTLFDTVKITVLKKKTVDVPAPQPVVEQKPQVNPNPQPGNQTPVTTQTPATTQAPQTVTKDTGSAMKGEVLNVGGFSRVYLHKNKTAEIIKVSTSKKTVTVPSYLSYKGVKYKVTTIGESAFKGSRATKIALPGTLKYIDEKAFYGCKKLTSITLPGSTKSVGKSAFYGCNKLSKVTVNSTKITYVGKSAFKKCSTNLTIKVPKNKKKAYQKLWKGKGGTVK